MTNKTKIDPSSDRFLSPFRHLMAADEQAKYGHSKRTEGLQLANEGLILHVGREGLWWATSPDHRRTVESFEKIGYHTLAEQLLIGFLEADGTCFFHGFKGIEGEVEL